MVIRSRQKFVADIAARYGKRLRRFLGARVGSAVDVPDLAQEVFLRLMRVGHHETIRSPEAYLFTVARHVLHQHSLRQASMPASVDFAEAFAELQQLSADSLTAQVDLQQSIEALERMLEPLPPRVSATLLLHRCAGYTIEEIAKQLGIARPTAKKYLAMALAHCRNVREASREASG